MQRFSYDLVRDMGTIKIGCIDMVHAACNDLSQNSNRFVDITGGPHTNLLPSRPASCIAPQPLRFTVIDVPGSVKLPARSVCLIISVLPELFVVCSEEN